MIKQGFYKVAAAIPEVRVADCDFNVQQIKKLIFDACEQGVHIVCFPELSVTSYTCGDLFFQKSLIHKVEEIFMYLLDVTIELPICFIIGAPVNYESKLYNCALVCYKGQILGIVPKTFLPNYAEFYEKRWFNTYHAETAYLDYINIKVPFGNNILFQCEDLRFGVEICEDVWSVVPPSSYQAMAGAQALFNLSASDELIGKQQYVKSLISQQSARCQAAYIYAAAGFGESSTDLVYAGNAYVYENGKLLAESQRFQVKEQLIITEIDLDLLDAERRKNTTFINTLPPDKKYSVVSFMLNDPIVFATEDEYKFNRIINPTPFIPASGNYNDSCEEIFSIQVAGLSKRLLHTHAQSLVVGISGGLDSTLALLVCVKTADKLELPREMICGVTMPGFGTTGRTHANALSLMKSLGITAREISITAACEQHFKDIGHDQSVHNITYENTQARERTQILMDIANQQNGLVIGTGDMSELALGWATYNGDQMSMYGVNAGIPKTLVRHLVKWVAETQMDEVSKSTLQDIIQTPVSPELLPVSSEGQMTQFTEDVVGPYELHDFFLFYTLRYAFGPSRIYFLARHAFKNKYDNPTILKWMEVFFRRFFSQQFKRSCMPDGPKVGSVNLSPRGDWRMPSDASVELWLKEIAELISTCYLGPS
jgi:NAD+ synthase (glutamine-hydrolysing)